MSAAAIALVGAIKTTFDLIEKGVNEKASTAVLRDHITLLKERLAFISEVAATVEKEISDAEAEKARLEEQVRELNTQLAANRNSQEFVEHRGALFQRKPEGGYRLQVFCPVCRSIACAGHPRIPFSCSNPQCHWVAGFRGMQLEMVMEELPE